MRADEVLISADPAVGNAWAAWINPFCTKGLG